VVLTEPFIEELLIIHLHFIDVDDLLRLCLFLDDSAVAPNLTHFVQIFAERLSLVYTLMMLFDDCHILLTFNFFTFLKFVLDCDFILDLFIGVGLLLL